MLGIRSGLLRARPTSSCRNIATARGRCWVTWKSRAYSSTRDYDVQTFDITCGSSGSISVDIYNKASLSANGPLIIYLPPAAEAAGPPLDFFTKYEYAVACFNYRWKHRPFGRAYPSPLDQTRPFPTPVHDVLHAYTWLISTLRPSPEIYIYGSRLGGTLATSLALTESRSSKNGPQIKGLLVKDGIFDWTGVATSKNPILPEVGSTVHEEPAIPRGNWTTQTLHDIKTSLFSDPSQCFDPFASPILFFRGAGSSVPSYFPGTKRSAPAYPASVEDIFLDEEGNLVELCRPASTEQNEEEIQVLRRAHLRFPPKGSGLKIPRSLFMTSVENEIVKGKRKKAILEEQADEIVHLMRRSVTLHEGKERKEWDYSFDPHLAAEERVKHRQINDNDATMEERIIQQWIEDGR
ncbi:hypothetical protein BP6252_06488 [Coleophoma cylindrospora]|uniref:Alpha/beta hydrolase fold-3 domain-containing protein n=1 Tax=Coleophoma cylindrospora TaxID=1849047 RepID=A0A3D8RN33_9HELO|nr:hypothetical protein BP6252_06488 [Coleophoma cylindrospora]